MIATVRGIGMVRKQIKMTCLLLLISLIVSACGNSSSDNPEPRRGVLATQIKTEFPPPSKLSATPANLPQFIAFESGHVRPLALSSDEQFLYAVNTPNNSLDVWQIENNNLIPRDSIPVGLEPVAVAVRDQQVWVVNHLSDSVSIIDMSMSPPRVSRTLLVGDEPRDIVFAGSNRNKAFITTAHRGQNSPINPQFTTAGIGRADVWVFDAENLGESLGGDEVTIVNLFGDTPRPLAVSADGAKVYAAVFNSGNRTTSVHQVATLNKAAPFNDAAGEQAPLTGYIFQFRNGHWRDEDNVIFDQQANLNLPDYDLFTIDANANVPMETDRISGVGTTLFNIAIHPTNNKVFVSNLEARNHVRFEGMGTRSTTVRGHFVEERISIIDDGQVKFRNLNKHLERNQNFATAEQKDASLSLPMQMAFNQNGSELYLVAMGSNKIAVLDTDKLDTNEFVPSEQKHIVVSGGGPTGILVDESRGQAYVSTRFDNGISVIDLEQDAEVSHVTMFNPEPEVIVNGRPFLYDATITSSNGAASCAGCHIFGDTDHLSWDLGNPEEITKPNPLSEVPLSRPSTGPFIQRQQGFHPMKGPKFTQSLRGMPNHGPLHWRGDRTGTNPQNGETQEEAAFKEFNPAFEGLVGRDGQLSEEQMQLFTDFAMQLSYPPNPSRPLNNRMTPNMAEGHRVYTQLATSGDFNTAPGQDFGCQSCHNLDPKNGSFGSAGNLIAVLGNNSQDFKVPHFRNLYQKVGFFRAGLGAEQIRGFGFSQNGATANLMDLLNSGDFTFEDPNQASKLAEFLFAYDSLLAPIVGQQITLSRNNQSQATERVNLLFERAQVGGDVPECDLVVHGVWDDEVRSALRMADDSFQSDKTDQNYSLQQLLTLSEQEGNHLTFMCVPPNSGRRISIDRDLDGILNGD